MRFPATFSAVCLFIALPLLALSGSVEAQQAKHLQQSRGESCNDACKIAAAKSYVYATVTAKSSDIAKVPFTTNATRYESFNGSPLSETAKSAADLRKSLKSGPQAFTVISSQDAKYYVARNGSVVSNYVLNAGLLLPIKLARAKVLETFEFEGDTEKIKKLVAYVTIGV